MKINNEINFKKQAENFSWIYKTNLAGIFKTCHMEGYLLLIKNVSEYPQWVELRSLKFRTNTLREAGRKKTTTFLK